MFTLNTDVAAAAVGNANVIPNMFVVVVDDDATSATARTDTMDLRGKK